MYRRFCIGTHIVELDTVFTAGRVLYSLTRLRQRILRRCYLFSSAMFTFVFISGILNCTFKTYAGKWSFVIMIVLIYTYTYLLWQRSSSQRFDAAMFSFFVDKNVKKVFQTIFAPSNNASVYPTRLTVIIIYVTYSSSF